MKKILILSTLVISSYCLIGQSFSVSMPSEVSICGTSNQCTIFVSGFNPGTYVYDVTLNILLGSQQTLMTLIPYPECIPGGGSSIGSPVLPMVNQSGCCSGSVSNASVSMSNALTNTYSLSFDVINNSDGTIFFDVILDCSLIPTIQNYSQLELQQVWTFNGTPIANQPANAKVKYPYIIDPPQNTLTFNGNYKQQEDMIFAYQNIGNAPSEIAFSFTDLYSCFIPAYQPIVMNPIMYEVAASQPLPGSFTNVYTGNDNVIIPPNEFLYIKYSVDIVECVSNSNCALDQKVMMTWHCSNAILPDNCNECDHYYISNFSLITETPHFEITRIKPLTNDPNTAFYDLTCLGEKLEWEFEIKNTSQYTTFTSLNVELKSSSTLVAIEQGDVSIVSTSCATCTTAWTHGTLYSSPCGTGLLPDFNIEITGGLSPNETVSFKFKTYKCCANQNIYTDANDLFDIDKLFNHWFVEAKGIDKCSITHSQTTAANDDAIVTASTGGISSHSPEPDVDLKTTFQQFVTDVTICAGTGCSCIGIAECADVTNFGIRMDGLFGDNAPDYFDHQILGFKPANPDDMNGIFRVKIHCDEGLYIESANDVTFTDASGANGWAQIINTAWPFGSQCTCTENDYYFYFDIGAISFTKFESLFNGGYFHFKLKACCPNSKGSSKFKVEFTLLPNPSNCITFTPIGGNPSSEPLCSVDAGKGNCIDCSWIPLSTDSGFINVHCCGCITPGIIVDHYDMLRETFGLEDDNNDRIADGSGTAINAATSYFYSDNFLYNRHSSIHGDYLVDKLVAHFYNGSDDPMIIDIGPPPICGDPLTSCDDDTYQWCNQGYTYNPDMTSAPGSMHFDNLQLRRKIDFSNVNEMNLEITGLDFYIDDPVANNPGSCIDCNEFNEINVSMLYVCPQKSTVFHLEMLDATDLNKVMERDGNEYLFTFKLSDIANGSLNQNQYSNSNFIYPNDYPAPYAQYFNLFRENQQYRLLVRYKVCGNKSPKAGSAKLGDMTYDASIENEMWLIGGATPPTLSNHLNFAETPKDLRKLADCVTASNEGFYFPNFITPGNPDPPTCMLGACPILVAPTQTNFAELFKFICEPLGGIHRFYSSDMLTLALFPSTISCKPSVELRALNTIVRNVKDVFEYEFRPPSYFPSAFTFNNPYMPGYYLLNDAKLSVIHAPGFNDLDFAETFSPGNISGTTIHIDNAEFTSILTTTTSPFDIPLCTGNMFDCRNSLAAPACPTLYDQYSDIRVNLNFKRINCDQPIPPSLPYPGYVNFSATDAQIEFMTSINIGCIDYNVNDCSGNSTTIDINGPNLWYETNPNLEVNFLSPSVNVTSNVVCWDFKIRNPPLSLDPPYETDASNVFIELPSFPNNDLSGWTLNYSYIGPPVNNLTATNNIIHIIDNMPKSSTLIMSGTLCANYLCNNLLWQPINFNVTVGSTCHDNFNGTQPVCQSIIKPLEAVPQPVNLVVDAQASIIPTKFTLCSDNEMKVCFRSMDQGSLQPYQLDLKYNPDQMSITSAYLVNCSNPLIEIGPLSAAPISPDVINYVWDLSTTGNDIHEVGVADVNGYMHQNECVCFKIIYHVNCMFDDELDLPELNLTCQTYCGLAYNSIAEFNSAQRSSDLSECENCYKIDKTVIPATVEQGEPLVYTVTVTSYNNSSTPGSISISDLPPNFFYATANNIPANAVSFTPNNWQAQQSYTIEGYYNCDVSFVPGTYTNTAWLTSASPPLEASVPVDVESDCACNTPNYIVGNDANSVTLLSTIEAAFATATNITIKGTLHIDVGNLMGWNIYVINAKNFKMGPGSKIIVDQGWNLWINDCVLEACSKMWKGIDLSDGTGLFATSAAPQVLTTRISDAENAILMKPKSTSYLRNCDLIDNYVGINIVPEQCTNGQLSWPCANGSVLVLDKCKIMGTGTMVLPYQSQTTTIGNWPFAGIYAKKSTLNLTPATGNINEFKGLSNGVISFGGDLTVEGCTFENIHADATYNGLTPVLFQGQGIPNSFNGSAIYAKKWMHGEGILLQKGLGNQSTDPFTFKNCDFGIYGEAMHVTSEKNKMEGDMGLAYRITLGSAKDIVIKENNLTTQLNAIDLYMNDGSNKTLVWYNNISFGNKTGGNFRGINIAENGGNNINSDIYYNFINLGTQANRTGVYSLATTGFNVTLNTIWTDVNANNQYGISTDGCTHNIVSCNYVTGSGDYTVTDQAAIKNFMGMGMVFSCNNVDKTLDGICFSGAVANGADVRGNYFKEHQTGLHLMTSAVVGPQKERGNYWEDPAAIAAIVPNYLSAASDATQVSYNPVTIGPGTPPVASAVFFPSATYVDPSSWFQQTLIANWLCSSEPCPSGDCPDCRNQFDETVARDSITNDPYTPETRIVLKRGLYEKIDDNPAMQTDTVMANFYYNNSGTAMAYLKAVNDEKNNLFGYDSINAATMNDKQILLKHYSDTLNKMLTVLKYAIDSGNPATLLYGEMQALQDSMATLKNNIDSLTGTAEENRNDAAEGLATNNAAIYSGEAIENNERDVNDIYLNTIALGNFEFTTQQISTLDYIRLQCPLSGGNAVFKARALYELIEPNVFYNDKDICNRAGISLRIANELAKPTATIYPNPTNEKAILAYDFHQEGEGELRITNAIGQFVSSYNLQKQVGSFEFSTKNFKPGIYYCTIYFNNIAFDYIKLVVIR